MLQISLRPDMHAGCVVKEIRPADLYEDSNGQGQPRAYRDPDHTAVGQDLA